MADYLLLLADSRFREKVKYFIENIRTIWGKRHNLSIKPLPIPEIKPVYIESSDSEAMILALLISETARKDPVGIMIYGDATNEPLIEACKEWEDLTANRGYPLFFFYDKVSPGLFFEKTGFVYPSISPRSDAITINDYFISQQIQKGVKYESIEEAMGITPK